MPTDVPSQYNPREKVEFTQPPCSRCGAIGLHYCPANNRRQEVWEEAFLTFLKSTLSARGAATLADEAIAEWERRWEGKL